MDKQAFFASIRRDLFEGGLTPQQVYRIEVLLDACVAADWPLAFTSYALATSHHETAQWKRMKELGGDAYFKRMYDKAGARPKVAATLGNVEAGDGVKFAGRGYVQLTGRANFTKAGKALGLDLLKEPGKVEEPTIAAKVLIWGMSTGAYTGKANRDYLDKSPPDYAGARRIINGTDRASLIASHAKTFEKALIAAGYGAEVASAPKSADNPPSPSAPVEQYAENAYSSPAPSPTRHDGEHQAPASEGFWARFFTGFWKRVA